MTALLTFIFRSRAPRGQLRGFAFVRMATFEGVLGASPASLERYLSGWWLTTRLRSANSVS